MKFRRTLFCGLDLNPQIQFPQNVIYISVLKKFQNYVVFNPLSANVGYTPYEGDVTCSRCGA